MKDDRRIAQSKPRIPARKGQVSIEFTFAMIVVLVLIYGLVMVFRWSGMSLFETEQAHTTLLTSDSNPKDQVQPVFSRPQRSYNLVMPHDMLWGQ